MTRAPDHDEAMETKTLTQEGDLESRWRQRENMWRRKLGRLKLGVEPIEEQLTRYRRVTWALTAVPTAIGLMFLTLFTVFGRPDIGVIFDAIVLLPIVIGAWLDYALLVRRATRYLAELGEHLREKAQKNAASTAIEMTSEQA
jgi:fatty acid desaturase